MSKKSNSAQARKELQHINFDYTAIITVTLGEDTEFQLLGDLLEWTEDGFDTSPEAILNSQRLAWDLYQDAVTKGMPSYFYMDHLQRLAILHGYFYGIVGEDSHH